jgi:serine/threonine protein phosphatase PrpC
VSPASVVASIHARTDPGRTRDHNEDTFLVADLTAGTSSVLSDVTRYTVGPRGLLLLVADGMGGAAAGELASAMAADLIFGHLLGTWARETDPDPSPDVFTTRMREAVELANLQIHAYARDHPEVRGMGTTATVAGILGRHLFLAQVGDSRAYLVRQGTAVQVTKDQSLMQRLVDAGELTEEEARASTRRNIILQALGPDPQIRVELTFEELTRGDTLVLCSDGLSGQVRKEEIAEHVAADGSLEQIADRLIQLANSRGGPDNITVVLARFEGPGLPEPDRRHEPAYHVYDDEGDAEEPAPAAAPAVPAPAPDPGTPVRRTGTPSGLAFLLVGLLLVALALFLALT